MATKNNKTNENTIDFSTMSLADIKAIYQKKLEAQEKELQVKGAHIKTDFEAFMKKHEFSDYSEATKIVNKLFKPKTENSGVGRGHKLADEKREQIKEALKKSVDAKNGKGTASDYLSGAAIAKKFDVSLPTVQSIKKEMGLVAA